MQQPYSQQSKNDPGPLRYPQAPQYPQQILPGQPPAALRVADRSAERALSALAHGAIAFGLVGIGFVVSLAVAGIIWLYSRRSPEVRFHSEQAGCYQCLVVLTNIFFIVVLGSMGGLAIVEALRGGDANGLGWGLTIGLVLWLAWFAGSILYGIVAAVLVMLGKPFKYPVVGDWFDRPGRRS